MDTRRSGILVPGKLYFKYPGKKMAQQIRAITEVCSCRAHIGLRALARWNEAGLAKTEAKSIALTRML